MRRGSAQGSWRSVVASRFAALRHHFARLGVQIQRKDADAADSVHSSSPTDPLLLQSYVPRRTMHTCTEDSPKLPRAPSIPRFGFAPEIIFCAGVNVITSRLTQARAVSAGEPTILPTGGRTQNSSSRWLSRRAVRRVINKQEQRRAETMGPGTGVTVHAPSRLGPKRQERRSAENWKLCTPAADSPARRSSFPHSLDPQICVCGYLLTELSSLALFHDTR